MQTENFYDKNLSETAELKIKDFLERGGGLYNQEKKKPICLMSTSSNPHFFYF